MKFYLTNSVFISKKLSLILILLFFSCDKLKELGRENIRKKLSEPNISPKEMERWKEQLGIEEAEIVRLDEQIRKMVKKTKEAGALSWKIARAYMKTGSYHYAAMYYDRAIHEKQGKDLSNEPPSAELHSFESAIPFFEKTALYKDIDEELLFETGLAYANASKDRGWDKQKRSAAISIFKGLTRKNPEDLRYPYELALIYFDSSMNDGLIDGVDPEGYNDSEKAMKILYAILNRYSERAVNAESKSLQQEAMGAGVSIRFTLANFLYRQGKSSEAEQEYVKIKTILEKFKEEGRITENLEKNSSYMNVIKNLKKIQETR